MTNSQQALNGLEDLFLSLGMDEVKRQVAEDKGRDGLQDALSLDDAAIHKNLADWCQWLSANENALLKDKTRRFITLDLSV